MEANEDEDVLDVLVEDRLMIKAQLEKLKSDLQAIDNRLRLLGPGDHETRLGRMISIKPANRVFDVEAAARMVEPAVRQRAITLTWDAAVLKEALTPAQLQTVMRPGNGQDRVVVS